MKDFGEWFNDTGEERQQMSEEEERWEYKMKKADEDLKKQKESMDNEGNMLYSPDDDYYNTLHTYYDDGSVEIRFEPEFDLSIPEPPASAEWPHYENPVDICARLICTLQEMQKELKELGKVLHEKTD